jgi:pheromone shutdown protein TraB
VKKLQNIKKFLFCILLVFDQSLKDRIFFLGTMHIQQESVDAVLKAIDQCHPDVIMVELDVLRYKELIQQVTPKKKTQNMLNTTWSQVPDSTIFFQPNSSQLLPTSEINPVHQLNQDFFELLHQFQQSLGDIMGILPGKEMLVAVNAALTRKIPALFIDRPIMETMQRIQSVGNQIQTEQKHIMKSMKENPLSANELQEFIGKFRDPSNVREVISEFDYQLIEFVALFP